MHSPPIATLATDFPEPYADSGESSEEDELEGFEGDDVSSTPPYYIEAVQMRRDPHDKPRRLLALPEVGVLSVTMRCCFDLVEQSPLRCSPLRPKIPEGASHQMVDDACLLSDPDSVSVLVGRSGVGKLSLFRLRGTQVCGFCWQSYAI